MTEPISSGAGAIYGVKYASLLAGFAGGIVSLSYMRQLTAWQMALAVVTGALIAGYLTPIAQHWIGLPEAVENGLAFLLGLTSMNIVPGFMALSEKFKRDPESMLGGGPRK